LNNLSKDRILLAYSGSARSSGAVAWLRDTFGADVVSLTLDLGQRVDLTSVRQRALDEGALRAHVIEAREEFVRNYVLPSLRAGALYEGRLPLSRALGQALLAKRLVDLAAMEGAVAIACTSPVEADSVSRLSNAIHVLAPSLRVIDVPMSPSPQSRQDADVNLWGRTIDFGFQPSDDQYTLTRSLDDCPDEAAFIDIEFDAGVPVRANGIEMPLLELIESLEIIAGAHGVGRTQQSDDLPMQEEAPAALVLHTALRRLEATVLPAEFSRRKAELARTYAHLIFHGNWHSPARAALDSYIAAFGPQLTGAVRIELFKGACRIVEAPDTHIVSAVS
jgi:argininosuccinate synthase